MLNTILQKNATMEGRSVDMKIVATGEISDAYDMYINVAAYDDNNRDDMAEMTIFCRLIYWKTTHKKLVLGTITVLQPGQFPSSVVDEIEKISTPVEIKDYWKKSFEKYVVVHVAEVLKNSMWLQKPKKVPGEHGLMEFRSSRPEHILAYTVPVASYEACKRNSNHVEGFVEDLDHKCYDGTHGFVRSDGADNFNIPVVTSFPVTTLIV